MDFHNLEGSSQALRAWERPGDDYIPQTSFMNVQGSKSPDRDSLKFHSNDTVTPQCSMSVQTPYNSESQYLQHEAESNRLMMGYPQYPFPNCPVDQSYYPVDTMETAHCYVPYSQQQLPEALNDDFVNSTPSTSMYPPYLLLPTTFMGTFEPEPCSPSTPNTSPGCPSRNCIDNPRGLVGEAANTPPWPSMQAQSDSNAEVALHTTAPAKPGYRCRSCEQQQSICRGVHGYRICESCYNQGLILECDWGKKQDERQSEYMRAYKQRRKGSRAGSARGRKG
jgi:hypothetical protein